MILALHGFGSTGEGSSTCQAIKTFFSDEQVLTPTYNVTEPFKTAAQLKTIIHEARRKDPSCELHIVGISFGGFLARWLAFNVPEIVDNLIMINPVLNPSQSLTKKLGTNTNYVTGEIFEITNDHIEVYRGFKICEATMGQAITVIIGLKDNVIDPTIALNLYKNRAHIVLIPDGDHRLSGYKQCVLEEIKGAINTIAGL